MTQAEINKLTKEGIALKKQANALLEESNLKTAEEVRLFKKSNEGYKKIVANLKDKNTEVREAKNAQKELVDIYIQQESKLKGLTGLQASLVDQDRARIKIMSNAKNLDEGKRKVFESIASLQNDLLNTSSEDVVTQGEINRQLDAHYADLEGAKGIHGQITKNLKTQRDIATNVGNLTEKQQKFLNKQLEVYESIKDTIGGALETASLLLSTTGGRVGALAMGAGVVADKFGKVNTELGTTLFQTDGVARNAGVLSFFFDDAAQNAKDLSAELGDTGKASLELQTNIGLMSKNMGISGTEATKLVGALSRLNGGSTGVASDMVATSKEFAKQNGIIPAQLMGDLAASTEEFALFGKDGGKNILEAAGYAAKLGTNMSTLSGIADGLLDFETSITKELELGAMLGKNINLSKARELAYSGDIEGATKETLKQLGGIDAFNRMDYYQKKQTADLLGVSVAELQKMNSNMEQAGTIGSVINEEFSAFNEIVNAGVNSALGTTLKTLGSVSMAAAQMGGSFAQMGLDVKGIASKMPIIGKFFGGGAPSGPLTKAGKPDMRFNSNKSPSLAKVPKGPVGNPASKGGIMESMGKIKMSSVLKGAAAMVLIAASLFILGKALQEFKDISGGMILGVIAGFLGLGVAMMILGAMFTGPQAAIIAMAALGMLLIASSLLVLGLALNAIGTGFTAMGTGLATLIPTLTGVMGTIMGMMAMIGPIALLSYALVGLSAAMMGLGVSMAFLGIAGLPGLMMLAGIAAVSGPIIKLAGILGIGDGGEVGAIEGDSLSQYETNMLDKMDQLITATSSHRDVYLDRDKVTNIVMTQSQRSSRGQLNLNNT